MSSALYSAMLALSATGLISLSGYLISSYMTKDNKQKSTTEIITSELLNKR